MSDPLVKEPPEDGEAFIKGRYPYTYCADQIRIWSGTSMSRSEAAGLKRKLAEAVGMAEAEFAYRVADAYLKDRGMPIRFTPTDTRASVSFIGATAPR
jgi:hypothetical protein